MIIDRLDQLKHYQCLHPLFVLARQFLERSDLAKLAPGRYDLGESDGLFAIITHGDGYADPPRVQALLEPGDFAILFPEDAHAPTAVAGRIHKAVVKVPIIGQ